MLKTIQQLEHKHLIQLTSEPITKDTDQKSNDSDDTKTDTANDETAN